MSADRQHRYSSEALHFSYSYLVESILDIKFYKLFSSLELIYKL